MSRRLGLLLALSALSLSACGSGGAASTASTAAGTTAGPGAGAGGQGAGSGGAGGRGDAGAGGGGAASSASSASAAAGGAAAGSGGAGGAAAYQDNFVQDGQWADSDGSPVPWPSPHLTDIEVDASYVYVCAGAQGLIILDRATLRVAYDTGLGPYPRCQHIAKAGDVLVATSRGDGLAPQPLIALFRVTDPPHTDPLDVYFPSGGVSPEGVVILKQNLYAVAAHGAGLLLVMESPGGMSTVKTLPGFENAWDLALDGDMLYVADDAGGVAVVDVSAPASPVLLGHVPLAGSVKHVAIGGGLLFASAGSSGVHTLSLATPESPVLLSTFDTPGSVVSSVYSNGRLFVADWNDVRILDMTDPTSPALIGTESVPSSTLSRVLSLAVDGDDAYLAEWDDTYHYRFVSDAGDAPDVRLDTTDVRFPATDPGSQAAYSVVVQNEGRKPLTVSQISGDDVFVPLQSSLALAPGAKDFVEIRFKPTSASPAGGQVVFTTDDPDEPTVTVQVAGNTPGLGVGDAVPDWAWVDVATGQTISTQGLAGNVVLLSYFATF